MVQTAQHQVSRFFTPTLGDWGEVEGGKEGLQSCCVPAEGAAAGPGPVLELLREVAQLLFALYFH